MKEIFANGCTLENFCKLHKHLFGEVYNFAGQLREVDMEKPERVLGDSRSGDGMSVFLIRKSNDMKKHTTS